MRQFSIITPTYNRANFLPRVYDCLLQQGDIDFEWVIVDDGSSDNTKDVVSTLNGPFDIKYINQENSGKPKAVNRGVSLANSYISLLHDDDDTLLPNILPLVWKYFDPASETFQEGCACVSGLCVYDNGKIIGDKFPFDYHISDNINYRDNKKIKGDKCEFFLTSILKTYPFPVINNEKFIGESLVWNRIALNHRTIYINEIFLKKVFLEDGLSNKPIWTDNPHSSELFHNEMTNPRFLLSIQLINYAKYIRYAKINKKSLPQIYSSSHNKKLFLPGLLFYVLFLVKQYFSKLSFMEKRKKKRYWKKIT